MGDKLREIMDAKLDYIRYVSTADLTKPTNAKYADYLRSLFENKEKDE